MQTIFLVRHGETQWNKEGKLQGWLDSDLTERGLYQAKQLQKYFINKSISKIYSSDLGRAISTAKMILPKQTPIVDKRLREIYLGDWQNKQIVDLEQDIQYQLYKNNPLKFEPTTQETFDDVGNRMVEILEEISQDNNNIVVVSHGVAIQCFLWKCLLQPLQLTNILDGCSVLELTKVNNCWSLKKKINLNSPINVTN